MKYKIAFFVTLFIIAILGILYAKNFFHNFDPEIEYLSDEAVNATKAVQDAAAAATPIYDGQDAYDYYFKNTPLEHLPKGVKDQLIEFYKTEEGSNYKFVVNGNMKVENLLRNGAFTGKENLEVAIVLKNKDANYSNRFRLLVFAIKKYTNDEEFYLILNEEFYDNIVIRTLYKDPEDRWEHRIYKNSEELVETETNSLVVSQPNKPDIAYVYDEKFDKMIGYTQIPKSKMYSENANEE